MVAAIGVTGSAMAAKTTKTRAYTENLLGAQILSKGTAFQSVYKVTGSNGNGAAVQVGNVKGTTFPISGSDRTTTYYANGASKTVDTWKLGAPNSKGISSLTGSGKCVAGGTGVHKNEKCSYTFKGTYNTTSTVTALKLTGTETR